MTGERRGAPALMLQGTGSDVGKSLLLAGLARAYARRGLRVRPFKPQNMSNNAAVTAEGGEIGRAQALQARACGIEPTVDMNPVLLKPQGPASAQIILQGKVFGSADARAYHALKPELLPHVLESFTRIGRDADLVLVEGAGSPAEVNLREGDIANMGFAEAARVPVLLVGDIDRGGVLASLVGTVALLAETERRLVKGYIVNKFRGDPTLFCGAIDIIGERTGLACLGIVPFFPPARRLPAEDSAALDGSRALGRASPTSAIKIAVPRLARIANFDDLDPLIAEPDVIVDLVETGRALPGDADLIILPGSKATRADLEALRETGWDVDIAAHLQRGGWVLGLCSGYQMLGRSVADPLGIEGAPGETQGLGLLAVDTELKPAKRLGRVRGRDRSSGERVEGYEMHMGETTGPDRARPMLELEAGPEGARSADGRVQGCYLHGLFAADGFRHAYLNGLKARAESGLAYEAEIESLLDDLADHVGAAIELERLLEIADGR